MVCSTLLHTVSHVAAHHWFVRSVRIAPGVPPLVSGYAPNATLGASPACGSAVSDCHRPHRKRWQDRLLWFVRPGDHARVLVVEGGPENGGEVAAWGGR